MNLGLFGMIPLYLNHDEPAETGRTGEPVVMKFAQIHIVCQYITMENAIKIDDLG
jgi:hypothetical protein